MTPDQKVKQLHKTIYKYKIAVENMKIVESEKERLLGLPFLMKRLQQYPEPALGTWQYDIFEELFNQPYSYGKDEVETEEKIHKFNYKQFLHPSVIEKFNDDPENPDFEMYIKMLNVESKTRLEEAKLKRKFFCQNILPKLNLLNDEEKGRQFAFYFFNRLGNKSALEKHFYDNYSNQEEEALFREAEESRLVNKNPSVVEKFEMTTIKSEYRAGIRNKELKEILSNPQKKNAVERALKAKFKHSSPTSKYELLKQQRNKLTLIDTAIEEGIDINNPEENNLENLFNKTADNPDLTELEEASRAFSNRNLEEGNSFPYGHPNARFFRYDNRINFDDYQPDIPNYGYASFKNNRYEYRAKEAQEKFVNEHSIKFRSKTFADKQGFVIPHLSREDDEAQEKIFKKRPLVMTEERKNLYNVDMSKIDEFVNKQVEQDSSLRSTDITEDELNQAIFEAQYQKPIEETDEFRRLNKRTKDEIISLFKSVDLKPDAFFDHEKFVKNENVRPEREIYQYNDPLYGLFSEVEQPTVMRRVLKEWRSGSEIRTKLPYYPETKKAEKYHSLI